MRYCDECGGHVIIVIGSMWSKLNFCSPACSLKYHRRIKELADKEANECQN